MPQLLGNKAATLQQLAEAGFPVPPFVVIPLEQAASFTKELPEDDAYIVRSSATAEDGEQQSMAGQFLSVFPVRPTEVSAAIAQVAESITSRHSSGSVIVQQLIPTTAAGVLFTNVGDGTSMIEANIGLCSTVVQGSAVDRWTYEGNTLIDESITSKTGEFADGSTQHTSSPALTPAQCKQVLVLGANIEAQLGSAQDIEFGFVDNELYVFQSRPITADVAKPLWHFDSANIAESYSGVVLPLTASFAQEIYQHVYQDLLVASGVSRNKVQRHQAVFTELTAHHYGRLYYNMNRWYQMMAFLPGYDRNKQNLEDMITSNIRVHIPRDIRPSWWLRIGYGPLVVWKLVWFWLTVRLFTQRVRSVLQAVSQALAQQPSLPECRALYAKLHRHMLRRWYITVENDFIVMSALGALKKLVPDEQELMPHLQFANISADQIHQLIALGKTLYSYEEAQTMRQQQQYAELYEWAKNHRVIGPKLAEYLHTYGGRFASELKLESPDVSVDPEHLLGTLYQYALHTTHAPLVPTPPVPLTGVKRVLFTVALTTFKRSAARRERLRLLRSQAFSVVRTLFHRIGELHQAQGRMHSVADIFYLTVEEALHQEGSFNERIAERQQAYTQYESLTVRTHFSAELPVKQPDIALPEEAGEVKAVYSGRGCCPGQVTGSVTVMPTFSMPNEPVDIVVARNTDPGWTPLLGLCRGLIVEQGGLLSHAAIVARELGIPTIIGIPDIMKTLNTGDRVTLNASTGTVEVHDS